MTNDPDGKDWEQNVLPIQWALNSLKHSITGKTPQELLMSYKPRNIFGNKLMLILDDEKEYDEDNIPLSELREQIMIKMNEKRQKHANNFNAKHQSPQKYCEGDLVLIKQEAPSTGFSRKLYPRYRGPYQIKKVLENDRYVVTDTDELQLKQKRYESVHAADRLKRFGNIEDMMIDDFGEISDDEY